MVEEYIKHQEASLDKKHFAFSLKVMGAMQYAVPHYGLDPEEATTAGLLHNMAAMMNLEEMMAYLQTREERLMRRLNPEFLKAEYLIGPASANMAHEKLGLRRLSIFDAIRGHTGLFEIDEKDLLTRCLSVVTVLVISEDQGNKRAALARRFYFENGLDAVEKALEGRARDKASLERTGPTVLDRLSNPSIT